MRQFQQGEYGAGFLCPGNLLSLLTNGDKACNVISLFPDA